MLNMKQLIKTWSLGCGLGLAGALVLTGPAIGQPPPPQEPPQEIMPEPAPPEVPEVSEEQLDRAVEAYVAISDLQEELHEQLAGVEDQEEIQRQVERVQPKMLAAIEETGLQVEEYEQIIEVVNLDETMRMSFIEKLEALQPPEPELDPEDVTDQEVAQAAAIYLQVSQLNQQLQQELQGVEDQQVVQQRVAQAEQQMRRIVEDTGLDIEHYGMIMQAVQQDEELMQQFMQHIQPVNE